MKKKQMDIKKRVNISENEVNDWKMFFSGWGVKAEFINDTPKMTYATIEITLLKKRATVDTVNKIRRFIKNYEPTTI